MKILCVFGKHNYGDRSRGVGYEYANFIPALRRLGHDVIHFESFDRSCYGNFAELNQSLLQTVIDQQPAVVLFVLMHYEVWTDTLAEIRRISPAVLVHWGTDDSWKFNQFSRLIAPAFDLCATTYASALAMAEGLGLSNFLLSQWAANADVLAPPMPASECLYPVSFVGSAYGNRRKWIRALRERGIQVHCFGYGWEGGPVAAEEIPRIIRSSVISLNFGDSGLVVDGFKVRRSRQIKARVFEVTGAGGFLVTETAEDLERFFELDKEIVVFDDVDDLVAKIKLYLADPRRRDSIAVAGQARSAREHTYDERFRLLLERASAISAGRPASLSVAAEGSLEQAVRAHRLPVGLRLLRAVLNVFFRTFLPGDRGRRAARKLVFELSWRFVGSHTYTASGWPGRMYYEQS